MGEPLARPPSRLRLWVEIAEEAGWRYDESADGHPMLYPPAGTTDPRHGRLAPPVEFGKTPSDKRGDLNTVALLRRLGVKIPHKGYTKPKDKR